MSHCVPCGERHTTGPWVPLYRPSCWLQDFKHIYFIVELFTRNLEVLLDALRGRRWCDVHGGVRLCGLGKNRGVVQHQFWAPAHCRRVGVFSNGTAVETGSSQSRRAHPSQLPSVPASDLQRPGRRVRMYRMRSRHGHLQGTYAKACCYKCWYREYKDSMTFYSADKLLNGTCK